MKRILFLIAMLLGSITMFAQPRSEEQAKQIARDFFKKKPQQKAPMLSVVSQQKVSQTIQRKMARAKTAPAQHSSCYIINDEANNRFVIVSSDERMYNILGYSDNGEFDTDSLPQGLMDILYGYDTQYDYLLKNAVPSHNYKSKRRAPNVVEPLIKTKWDQSSPYNNECPEEKAFGIIDIKTVTGCVATAMAQVMNYHQYPAQGQGYTSYTTSSNIFQSMNFSSVNFDWSNMTDIYDESSSDAQKKAVAELMHACGVSVHMDYSWLESGAYSQDMAYALIKYFKYNPNIKYYERRYFSKDDWDDIIQEDLINGRPILYSGMGEGKNSDGMTYKYGHEFVLDGCDSEGKYHFNFGWSGRFDGFFELTAINPRDDSDFTLDQAMVCNVSPQTIGKHEDIFFATAVLYDKLEINVGGSTTATFDPRCAVVESNSYGSKFNGEFGIGVFDMNKNFVKALYKKSETRMSTGSYYEGLSASLYFDRSTFKEGSTYYIAPYAKASGSSDYTWMRTTYGLWDYYIATVDDGMVKLGRNPLPIPTGKVYASAFDANNTKKEWQFTLNQDPDNQKVYWFEGLDPQLSGSENRVQGTLDDSGTQIRIKIGQSVGNGLTITNYSSPGDIMVSVSAKDSVMSINDAWGTLRAKQSGDDIIQEPYTQYNLTEMTFKYVSVVKPLIIFNKIDRTVSITCSTEGATIYYTTDGKQPTVSSNVYSSLISVSGNCTIKAIAIKNGEFSEVAELIIREFVVEPPVITVTEDTIVSITCPTEGAVIYYTKDNTSPVLSSTRLKYDSTITIKESCTIKAYGQKDDYADSEIVEKYVSGPIDTAVTLVIDDNVAGQLEERVGSSRKASTKRLIVSGQLNGTDFAFIREMINNNKLSVLNIANTQIVSGGEPYYKTNYSEYRTENDVIGINLFYQCKNLTAITLPISAKTIKMYAFNRCEGLTDLVIPCQSIEADAICNCVNLETVRLSSAVKLFDGGNLYGCPKLTTMAVDNDNQNYIVIDGVLYSKDKKTIVKYPMGKEGSSFAIPNTVVTIGEKAFYYSFLESIFIPESVTKIESSAFINNIKLNNVELPNSIKKIGYMAFWGCRSITSIVIPSGLQEIESSVFYSCANLREVTIGKSITKIASDAFDNCSTLQKFSVDENNETFTTENGILYSKNMTSLVRCPLAYYAEVFRVPDGINKIESGVFKGCKGIGKIILPESVQEIGSTAFTNCSATSINMPSSITKIGYMAFWGCDQLEIFIIPKKVIEIEDDILYNCKKLSYLEIPKSIKKISPTPFYGCESLRTIRCLIKDIDSVIIKTSYDGSYRTFYRVPTDCTWFVPYGCSEKYKSQPWWVSTWNIIEEPQKGNLNGDDKVDIADAVTVLNIMAAGEYNEIADVNEDQKVDIADFVTILNIMAEQ